jgi:uncharacterized protein YukE
MSAGPELVRRWDVPACEAGVRRLFGIAEDLDSAYQRLQGVESRLAGWRGPAAAQALPRIRRAVLTVSALAATVRQVAQAVRCGLTGFAGAVRLARAVGQSPAELTEAASKADAVDRRVAAALGSVGTGPGVAVRSPSWTPAEVAAWWTALPPDQRRLAIAGRPEVIGALAGLPAVVRDAANRLQLSRLLRSLRAERDRLLPVGFDAVPEGWYLMTLKRAR